jgi:hypothetical protein
LKPDGDLTGGSHEESEESKGGCSRGLDDRADSSESDANEQDDYFDDEE